MERMMVKEKSKIDLKIEELENQLTKVQGKETEQYARIVGYYRAIKNWNKGKKEEYKYRVNFDQTIFNSEKNGKINNVENETKIVEDINSTEEIKSYKFFYRTTCPNCPPVKAIIQNLEISGESINADTSEGFTKAAKHEIFTAPTVLFLDSKGKEVTRTSEPRDINKLIAENKIK